jgi:16S rRNA G966 N2-methylase RsmD
MLRGAVGLEAAARKKAEAALAEERARHARILQDIQMECREPFVVPALLDAFVAVSQVVDGISVPQAD